MTGWHWIVVLTLAGLAACAAPMERVQRPDSKLVALSCTRINPVMQSAVVEAVVAGGGPRHVEVAGWMCGRLPFGTVRVVMLRYTPDEASDPPFLVPVLFEEGSLVAFGWHLLESQPERYGAARLPDRRQPWRAPAGWSCLRYRGFEPLETPRAR